jgi:hypothetical protein
VAPSDNGPWALQRMFRLGDHVFDRQSYDPASDVLTAWKSFGIAAFGVPRRQAP